MICSSLHNGIRIPPRTNYRLPCRHALPVQIRKMSRLRSSGPNRIEIVTDSNVPEGHQGLHGALYGDKGAEIHQTKTYTFREGEDEGEVLIPVPKYLKSRDGERPSGVYAVYDSKHNIQYIGYSRNIVLTLKRHLTDVGEDMCSYVRAMVFMNKAMSTKDNLVREAYDWLEREGTIPPGNGAEKDLWESKRMPELETMSATERAEYEDQKNKMRKAMGENLHDDVPGESLESKERRLKLIKAVKGDNWSAVIDQQTKETIGQDGIISPFAQAPIHRSVGNTESTEVEMNVENVDKALEEVRPYLIADGGNVEVVNVDDGRISLRLEGACGT